MSLKDAILQTLQPPQVNPFMEEQMHPWAKPCLHSCSQPLLRLWDDMSVSRIDKHGCMHAGAPRKPLYTREQRIKALGNHADLGNNDPTPFISFAYWKAAVEDFAAKRENKGIGSGLKRLTAINPNVRIYGGLPFVNMEHEMKHYGVVDPYGLSYKYYVDHYACLSAVTPEEVVCTWRWDALLAAAGDDWYERIVRPAFEAHHEAFIRDNPDAARPNAELMRGLGWPQFR
ncbi:hypothetical protein BJX66DRAFT_119537 [Aspergillus keveii]|uniref:Uncharacterized protein n=1 Tax=Aspergillus keveii TaxID=714993 RepID=A0ABR4FK65_9EURO